jgi:hypothetical protein
MTQTITRGYKALLDEANAQIETISVADAIAVEKVEAKAPKNT